MKIRYAFKYSGGEDLKKNKKICFFKKMCMFFIQFSSSCKQKLGVFSLCVLCVVLIFECILLQCKFAKDIISLDFSPLRFCFILFLNCDQFCSENWK